MGEDLPIASWTLQARTKISIETCDELINQWTFAEWDDFCNMGSRTDDPMRNSVLEEVYAHIGKTNDYPGAIIDGMERSQLEQYYSIIKRLGLWNMELYSKIESRLRLYQLSIEVKEKSYPRNS